MVIRTHWQQVLLVAFSAKFHRNDMSIFYQPIKSAHYTGAAKYFCVSMSIFMINMKLRLYRTFKTIRLHARGIAEHTFIRKSAGFSGLRFAAILARLGDCFCFPSVPRRFARETSDGRTFSRAIISSTMIGPLRHRSWQPESLTTVFADAFNPIYTQWGRLSWRIRKHNFVDSHRSSRTGSVVRGDDGVTAPSRPAIMPMMAA